MKDVDFIIFDKINGVVQEVKVDKKKVTLKPKSDGLMREGDYGL